ncbi:uncharacterized protein NECHADRAFT_85207 [Fusarium vanettenii 77-13-4]|uniref:Uncharacterized protein n=1 Tax=Fusarium vanettenii (strain ATCC MYA-4622 / CBS 123669 / FGSC 9596 / NRRL 45880 / 77-13-4) TaxID=660122 RepID=C7YVA6_FUSV7|nr:uncharacterized protein NECHADRAFT_85207 [Fusarium vanettenii 77-13-4]EEU44950.1 predicted protein [Fusarium vanettenii 77-13-4]
MLHIVIDLVWERPVEIIRFRNLVGNRLYLAETVWPDTCMPPLRLNFLGLVSATFIFYADAERTQVLSQQSYIPNWSIQPSNPLDPRSTEIPIASMAEILSIVSAAAGLLSFAVATLPKLDQFRRDFNGTDLRKEWYRTQMDSVHMKLEIWRELWCSQTYTLQDYEYFWGTQGYESMRTKIRLIEAELIAIGKLLERKVDWALEVEMDIKWSETRNRLKTNEATQMVETHASLRKRFTFALFRGAELEERIKRLQDKVKDLESFSQERFHAIQLSLPQGETLKDTTLHRLLARRDWMDEQEITLKYLYSLSTEHADMGWSLVLAVPGEDMSLDDDAGLWTTFDIQRCPGSRRDLGLASFYSTGRRAACLWFLEDLRRRRSPRDPLRRDPYLSSRFAEPRRRDDELRVALSEAAIGIVNWTMLLWGTPWTDGVCTCGLRFVTATLSNGSTQMAVTFQRRMRCDKDQFGHTGTIRARKALLLGISLAEFALTQPIKVKMGENGEPLFCTGGNWGPEKDLLDDVAARAGRPYREAVWYCFKYDRDLINNRDFRPHHFLLFQEHVVKQLDKHLKGVYKRMSLMGRRQP